MYLAILIKWLIAYYKQGDTIMVNMQDMKTKLDQMAVDVAALAAVHASGVVVQQADLDALGAQADSLDASIKALVTPPVVTPPAA